MIRRIGFTAAAARLAGALLFGMAVAAPTTAFAQESTPSTGVFKTGDQVFALCTSTKEADLESCDWFIMSAHDMIKFYGDTNMGGSKLCLPTGTKALEVRDTALAYWRNNAASRKFSAVSTIYNALTAKYPCANNL